MFKNYTPHSIQLVTESDTQNIPSQGIARVSELVQDGPHPLIKTVVFGSVTGLPEPQNGVWLIVSALVKSACPERMDLVSPHGMVRDSDGKIIGCSGFCR